MYSVHKTASPKNAAVNLHTQPGRYCVNNECSFRQMMIQFKRNSDIHVFYEAVMESSVLVKMRLETFQIGSDFFPSLSVCKPYACCL